MSVRSVAPFCLLLSLSLSLPLLSAVSANAAEAPIDTLVSLPGSTVVGAQFFVTDGDTIWLLEPFEVLGSRVPAALPGVLRQVAVLDESALERMPGRSAAEVLTTIPGVQTQQRQQYGVQSDLSIRGSTFEQVQVLLDGIDVSDPQTGHHLLNLPLGLHDIDRLEVLPGHGSALYGSGAFGGTINVATRKPGESNAGALAVTGGGNGIRGVRGSADLVLDRSSTGPRARISAAHFQTDGHDVHAADGTRSWSGADATTWTATAHVVNGGQHGASDLFFGYAHREFGARDFYAPYPSQERTETIFTAARFRRDLSDRVTIEPRLYFRRHQDRFVLYRDDPAAFTNNHRTRRAGAELRSIATVGHGFALATTVEGVCEDIVSDRISGGSTQPALGEHERKRLSLAAELAQNQAPVRYQFGVRLDTRSDHQPRTSVSTAVAWDFSESVIVRGSAGTVFRIPTYTEMYYSGGGNQGSAGLGPEQGWTWDWTVVAYRGPWSLTATYFERFEDDLIDWVRSVDAGADAVWQATNIAEGTTRGFETALNWQSGRGHAAVLSFTELEKTTTLPANTVGKYSLIAPRYLLRAAGTMVLPHDVRLTLLAAYTERSGVSPGNGAFCVVDSRLVWQPAPCTVTIRVTNLLERRYEEIPGVQMPGRLLTATLGWDF